MNSILVDGATCAESKSVFLVWRGTPLARDSFGENNVPHTCMCSSSCTYFLSVSMISRTRLLRAISRALTDPPCIGESRLPRESVESCEVSEGGDMGISSWKQLSGSRSTKRLTQFTTCVVIDTMSKNKPSHVKSKTYLDESFGRAAVEEFRRTEVI